MSIFSKPFPSQTSRRSHIRAALAFGAFVALFLWVFKPFGLDKVQSQLLLITVIYGAITSSVMLTIQLLVPRFFPQWSREEGWTVGREIVQTTANIVLIAIANLAFTVYLGGVELSLTGFALFAGFTLAVGIFPVSIAVLLRQNAYHQKHAAGSAKINTQLAAQGAEQVHSTAKAASGLNSETLYQDQTVELIDEFGKVALSLPVDDLLAAESADNYVKVYHLADDSVKAAMIRATISAVEASLSSHPRFMRTHRSWLVNLEAIEHVEGNARGYTLRIKGMKQTVPVARGRLEQFDLAMGEAMGKMH